MNFSQIQNNLNEINQMLDKREKEVTYSQSQPSVYCVQDGTGLYYSKPRLPSAQCRDKHAVFEFLGVSYEIGCVFPMVISSEVRVGRYRADGHLEDEPQFTM